MKFLTHDGLLYFWQKSKAYIDANDSNLKTLINTNLTNLTALINGKANTSHTHNYAGSSSAGGVATSALKLNTARTINGVSFDGTGNITVYDSTKLPTSGGTLSGQLTVSKDGFTSTVSGGTVSLCSSTLQISPGTVSVSGGLGTSSCIINSEMTNSISQTRNILLTTTDPGAGASSSLKNGSIIAVYE